MRVYFCLRHTKITLVSRIVSINDGLPIGKSKGIFFESFLVMLHFTTDQAGDENEERRFVLYLLPFHIFLALFFLHLLFRQFSQNSSKQLDVQIRHLMHWILIPSLFQVKYKDSRVTSKT